MVLDNNFSDFRGHDNIFSFRESILHVTLGQILDDPIVLAKYLYRQAVNTDNLGEVYQSLTLDCKEPLAYKDHIVSHMFGHVNINLISRTYDEVQLDGEIACHRTRPEHLHNIFKVIYKFLIHRSEQYENFLRNYMIKHIGAVENISGLVELPTEELLYIFSQITYKEYASELRIYDIYYIDDLSK